MLTFFCRRGISKAFSIFLINEHAFEWKSLPSNVFRLLKRSGCLDSYIIPHFDELHTLGKNYLIGDIEEYLKQRGEKIAEGL